MIHLGEQGGFQRMAFPLFINHDGSYFYRPFVRQLADCSSQSGDILTLPPQFSKGPFP